MSVNMNREDLMGCFVLLDNGLKVRVASKFVQDSDIKTDKVSSLIEFDTSKIEKVLKHKNQTINLGSVVYVEPQNIGDQFYVGIVESYNREFGEYDVKILYPESKAVYGHYGDFRKDQLTVIKKGKL